MHRTIAIIAAALLAVAGCSSDDDHDHAADGGHHHAGSNQDDHGCDHLKYGPHKTVTPGKDRASAPEMSTMSDTRVSLGAGAAGYLRFAANTRGDYAIYSTSNEIPLSLEDASGKRIAPKMRMTQIARCTEVKAKYLFSLAPAAAYYVKLGPAKAATTVSLVLVQPLTGGGMQHDGGGMRHDGGGMRHDGGGMRHDGDGMHHGG